MPWELLSRAPLDTIYTAIRQVYQIGSKHDFRKMTDAQESRLQQVIIAALLAESLAAKTPSVDPEVSYVVCLLRQLGTTLVSWNYPDEYETAVTQVSKAISLNRALSSSFGFDINLLTTDLIESWGFSEELNLAVSAGREVGDTGIFEVSGTGCFAVAESELKLLCDDAELISKACHLPTSTLSKPKTNRVKELLTDSLDELTFSSALEEGNQLVSSYKRYCTFEVSPTSREAIKKRMLSGKRAEALLESNSYLRNVPDSAYDQISYLYSHLSPSNISESFVSNLLAQIFATLGFHLVHVYFYNESQKLLVPSLSILGPSVQSEASIAVEVPSSGDELLRSAFELKSLLYMERTNSQEQLVMALAAKIGDDKSSGVLYVESLVETVLKSGLSPLAMFRAAFRSIADTLDMR